MKILYFDCFAGISGDMTLGALLGMGIDKEYLISELNKLNLPGWNLTVSTVSKNGISANYVKVETDEKEHEHDHNHEHEHDHDHSHDHEHNHNHEHKHCQGHAHGHNHAHEHNCKHGNKNHKCCKHSGNHKETAHSHDHRSYAHIKNLIINSGITETAKQLSLRIFDRVAKAEALIHNMPLDEVSFHEVGAVDSIIDIVGTAICMDKLQADKIMVSTVNDGRGFAKCQHGLIPIPVPAVLEIFSDSNIKLNQTDIDKELVTPTGAAIIAELAETCSTMPNMKVIKNSYGAGTRNLKIPNVLRLILGEIQDENRKDEQTNFTDIQLPTGPDYDCESSSGVTVLETNIDDTNPEILGYVMERLFKEGALDVFFTNIYMKKNRPATKLTVLCTQDKAADLQRIIFTETSTIGIRYRKEARICLRREIKTVSTNFGDVLVKVCNFEDKVKVSPEYEHAKALAESLKIPLKAVYDSINVEKI